MRGSAFLGAVAFIVAIASDGQAWQPIEGRVLQAGRDDAIAEVEIRVQLTGPKAALANLAKPQPFAVGRSDAAGRFRIDLPREAGPVAWDKIETVVVISARAGFRTHADHLRRAQIARPIEIRLERDLRPGGLSEALKTQLEKLRQGGANTIYLVPYLVRGQPGPGFADIAETLKTSLGRALRQHVSAFSLANPPPELSVKLLDPRELAIDDSTPLGAVADFLDALGVMAGRIDLGAGRPRVTTSILSTYHLSQSIAGLPASFKAEESMTLDAAHVAIDLQRAMNARWARLAVLAAGARELQQARGAGDVQRLRAVQQLLVQELRGTGRANLEFVPQLQALQRESEEALRRLGQR